jgi:Cd2+/Zn2+-exporting ATPase
VLDPVRAEAPGALAALHALGLGLAVLTGDRREVADAVLAEVGTLAGDLGDVDVRAACKPADKLAYVRAARAKRRVVLFVGDGINDAPALAAADVGVAMGAGGTAMAVDAADVAIMTDDLACLPAAVALGQAATAAIGQNVVLSVAFKLAVVAAAFAYDVPLWVAVSADLASLLAVVANGSRPMWARG